MKHAILFGDTHLPHHDSKALAVVTDLITDVKPHIIVNMGDLIDANQISRFPKDPSYRTSLQDDIDGAVDLMAEVALRAPSRCKFFYLEGNHEERLTRTINGMKDEAREIAGLRVFQSSIRWDHILWNAGLSKRGRKRRFFE